MVSRSERAINNTDTIYLSHHRQHIPKHWQWFWAIYALSFEIPKVPSEVAGKYFENSSSSKAIPKCKAFQFRKN